ncbi:helix-turn-helix domain-containing protein [Streptomyces sp. NPDC003077]|uniref:nSTAND1 domain-containing NTPase n=1 Tax=Streptomyces sp. NPDC003077 TaxID=3154443 RepID=UPI0033AF933E
MATDFGDELRRLRREKGVSLSALSRLAHYSKGYLSKIENGEKPPSAEVARICDQALEAGGALVRLVAARAPGDDCPYRGLAAYAPEDARWFFGRERATATLVGRLAERLESGSGPLVVAAPSGAGKSSLLKAGLLPALGSGALPGSRHWPARVLTPGARPLTVLAEALTGLSDAPEAADPPGRPDRPGPSDGARRPRPPGPRSGHPNDEPGRATATSGEVPPVPATPQTDEAPPAPSPSASREDAQVPPHAVRSTGRQPPEQPPPAPLAPPPPTPRQREAERLAADLAETPGRCAAAVRTALGSRARLVLVVDQFEEVFTVCEDARERRAFIGALCAAARRAPCAVVIGVRADFYGQCIDHPALVPALSDGVFALQPMALPELRAAITRPAQEAALELEPGLEELLLADLGIREGGEPVGGALPLLAHALLATWQQRQGRTLTVAGYRLTGGLHGAVATTAERVHDRLDPAEQDTARQVLLRLVQIGEIAGETRRRVPYDRLLEHLPDPEKTSAIIDVFVRARLLTRDADTVEIAHEALLHAWPRLRGWIRADRAGLLIHQRLSEAAGAWKREGREAAGLYRGTRLAVAREWAGQQGHRAGLSPLEEEFLRASQDREEAAARAERRQARRRRRVAGVLAVLLVLALAAGVLAVQQWHTAVNERRDALSSELAARSAQVADGQPEAAILLAAESYRLRRTAASRSALLSTQAQPFAGRLTGHREPVNAVDFAPDGRLLASGSSDGTVRLWDAETRHPASPAVLPAGPGRVRGVDFSPDGRLLAAGTSQGVARIWRPGRTAPVAVLPGNGAGGTVAFAPPRAVPHLLGGRAPGPGPASPDRAIPDTFRAEPRTARDTGTAHRTGPAARPAPAPGAPAVHAELTAGRAGTPAGRAEPATHQAGSPSDQADSPSGHADLAADHTGPPVGHTGPPLGHAGSPAGLAGTPWPVPADGPAAGDRSPSYRPLLAVSGAGGSVRVWDVERRRVVGTFAGRGGGDTGQVAFSPDGRLLARGDANGRVRVWRTTDGAVVADLTGHGDATVIVAFSPDSRLLAAGGADRAVTLYSTYEMNHAPGRAPGSAERRSPTVLPLATLTGHSDDINSLAFAPDGHTLASAGGDGTARLWEVATHRPVATFSGHSDYVLAVAFTPDGRRLATGSFDRTIALWNPAGSALTARPVSGRSAVAYAPGGRTLAAAGVDGSVRFWDTESRAELGPPLRVHGAVRGLAFGPGGRTLVTAGSDRTVDVWDVARRKRMGVLRGHRGAVFAVAVSPDGRQAASASDDRTVRLWDLTRRRQSAVLPGHDDFVNAVAFSPDGKVLASAGDDRTVRLWDVVRHRPLAVLRGHTGAVWGVAFGPDGRTIATAGNDRTVRLWDTRTRKCTGVLHGHAGSVRGVVFAPRGPLLATVGFDHTVRVWDAERRAPVATLSGHTDVVWSVAFAPDGRTLASTGADGAVRLWDLDADHVAARICPLVGQIGPARWHELLPDVGYRPSCRSTSGGPLRPT